MTETSEMFDNDMFTKFLEDTVIKSEPLDEDELQPEATEDFSFLDSTDVKTRDSVDSDFPTSGSEAPVNSDGPSTSRDPRIRSSMLPVVKAKRDAFLSGTLKAEDLIRGTARQESQPQQIKEIRKLSNDRYKSISSPSSSFYSTFPSVPVAPSGERDKRSPVISNNNSARFVSHATTDNIREALEARRVRNISSDVQKTAMRVGADIDSISQRMRPPVKDSQTLYSSNTRTTSNQTDPVSLGDGEHAPAVQNKTFASVTTQTSKNDSVLTIWSLTDLTDLQRKALLEFKKVMNIQDERTTGGILERIDHRKATKEFNNNNQRHKDKNQHGERESSSSRGGSSREQNVGRYSNPPPPQHDSYHQTSKRSKYTNCLPE